MTVYINDPDLQIHVGDVRDVLPTLPDESVDCVATSPPFYALRDYGVQGQIGLESTPDEWVRELVSVFRECRRLLRPHGTLWIECGDSYATSGGTTGGTVDTRFRSAGMTSAKPCLSAVAKPKDLIGAPWLLAFALRGPWYIGRIKKDIDRVWLAAMVDAEGCIHIHRRKAGESNYAQYTRKDGTTKTYTRKNDTFGVMVHLANTNRAIIENCRRIYGELGSISTQEAGAGVQKRRQTLHQWTVTGEQARDLLREIYPHLVAKKQQARVALACPSKDGLSYQDAIKLLHAGGETTVDGPEPGGLWEPGFYFRQAITWWKPNCMPESVRDRCTTAHSYVFLLSKQPRYFFDGDAIAEPAAWERWGDQTVPKHEGTATASGWIPARGKNDLLRRHGSEASSFNGRWNDDTFNRNGNGSKNARSVWTIPTRGYSGAHFATWPEQLAERIILAGCPERVCETCGKPRERLVKSEFRQRQNNYGKWRGVEAGETKPPSGNTVRETVGWSDCGHGNYRPGTVLDPFFGAGTTGLVARRLGRSTVGVELNENYAAMAAERLSQLSLLAEEGAA